MTRLPPIVRPLAAATALLGCNLLGCSSQSGDTGERADIFIVQRGDLPIRVTETAEVQPLETTRIKSEMEGQSTIIFLIEEGKIVEKGEKLVELDASGLEEKLAQQGITLSRAAAAKLAAKKELDIVKNEFEAEKLAGENAVRIARIDVEKFLGKLKYADVPEEERRRLIQQAKRKIVAGEIAEDENGNFVGEDNRDMGERLQQLVNAQANIKLAESEVRLAKNKLEWSKRLYTKDFITKDDLEKDDLAHQRQLKNLTVAQNELDILVKFTHPKEIIRLEQAVAEADTSYEAIIARGEARIAQADADLEAKEKEWELAKERYENYQTQIENAVIRAPTPGLVVYASGDGGRRGQQDFVEEGATVRERQTLIQLPDVTQMIAELKVHEASVDKVRAGQRALIKVDAFSGREFSGIVTRVSPVADSGSRWSNNGLKVYKTQVALDGQHEDLKPGMSASVTIIVAQLEDVVYVPKQAIQLQGVVPYVWLDTEEGPVARKVDLGLDDFHFVEITAGLEEGDAVYLAVPPGVIDPELEQPAEVQPAQLAPADDVGGPPSAREASAPGMNGGRGDEPGGMEARERGERRARGGGSAMRGKMQEILERKYPALAQVVKDNPRAWFSNDELRQVMQDDEELRAVRDEMMQSFRRGGGGGRGERGERRRGRGDGNAGGDGRPR